MIKYEFGKWGFGFLLDSRGNVVVQKSICVAVAPGAAAICWAYVFLNYVEETLWFDVRNLISLWGGFTFVLSFLLVFRTNLAYARYWEGLAFLKRIRGGWYNATSNLVSFTTTAPAKQTDVVAFQHLLIRLMSMMFCTALEEVSEFEDDEFGTLGEEGIEPNSLMFLYKSPDRLEIIMQWIQRLIIESHKDGIIDVAPPILSRVFQELSNGIVTVNDASRISEFPFPFPYAQCIAVMLIMHSMLTPLITGFAIRGPLSSGVITMGTVFTMWLLNYIAAEIEMPFGEDPNDLPLRDMQDVFNRKLVALVQPLAQSPPAFTYQEDFHNRPVVTAMGSGMTMKQYRSGGRKSHWKKQTEEWIRNKESTEIPVYDSRASESSSTRTAVESVQTVEFFPAPSVSLHQKPATLDAHAESGTSPDAITSLHTAGSLASGISQSMPVTLDCAELNFEGSLAPRLELACPQRASSSLREPRLQLEPPSAVLSRSRSDTPALPMVNPPIAQSPLVQRRGKLETSRIGSGTAPHPVIDEVIAKSLSLGSVQKRFHMSLRTVDSGNELILPDTL